MRGDSMNRNKIKHWKSSATELDKAGRSGGREIRCVKYSPSVKPPRYLSSIEKNECEARLWSSTFDTMGQLKALGLDDVKTFTKLNEQPYFHCAPAARNFVASYGSLARVENKKPKEQSRGHRYYAGKKDWTLPSIEKSQLPKIKPSDDPFTLPPHLLTGVPLKRVPYIPKTAIRIHWGAGVADNVDLICDWLVKKFGTILFTVRESRRRVIVVYKDMKSSYETVNAGIPPTLMTVAWCDPKFYNYGHYSMFKDYKLTKDPIWQRGLMDDD